MTSSGAMQAGLKDSSLPWISPPHGAPSWGGWLASLSEWTRIEFLDGLSPSELRALPWLFEVWAAPHQMAPEGDWRVWVAMGGRGAGKTRAGAEWVRSMVEGPRPLDAGRARRVALVAETYDQARDVMVFGESGIINCSPPDRKPRWIATERKLVWPNGAEAKCYSASDPEALRGPQFDAAWVDELAKWKKVRETWDMLQFALRLGDAPRVCVTTTPKAVPVLKELLALPSTVVTQAPSEANAHNLAPGFLEEVRARYAGTRLGRQELDGELLEDAEGALWTHTLFEVTRAEPGQRFDRVVVAVDPPATSGGDACGIVVAGLVKAAKPGDWRAVVIEDASVEGASPSVWAEAAVAAYRRHRADRVVAEVNQGGEMVEAVLRQVDPSVPYRAVRASRGKVVRAEPVAALYEQGRVGHLPGLHALEDEMVRMTPSGFQGSGSPDRADACVWAITELLIEGAPRPNPRLMAL